MDVTQLKCLTRGTTLYHKTLKNADGTPLRARVNGAPKTWVTRPDEVRVPMKHGLKACFYISEFDRDNWTTSEKEAEAREAPSPEGRAS